MNFSNNFFFKAWSLQTSVGLELDGIGCEAGAVEALVPRYLVKWTAG